MEEEADGLLKVIIVRGKNLAIRDFTSSDPYVVIKVGNMMAKTKVINSCLNPVWNEELVFSLREPLGKLKLEVFDRDRFKSDDKMGHAFLDLQPLVSASKLKRALQLTTGETKLRKVSPDTDNCLLTSSLITCVDGEVVQDVCVRLCDVESGELYLTVKWIGHPTLLGQTLKLSSCLFNAFAVLQCGVFLSFIHFLVFCGTFVCWSLVLLKLHQSAAREAQELKWPRQWR